MEEHRPETAARGELALASIAEQYIADLSTRAQPRTVRESRRALERLTRELPEISVAAVRQWRVARVTGGAAHKTVNNEVSALHAALALCVQDGTLAAHPLAGLRALPVGARHQRRRPRALTEEEVSRVLDAAALHDRVSGGFPRMPFVRTLLETGARYGELVLATWADFDRDRAALTFRAETTKTARARTIPLRPELAALIEGLGWECRRVTGKLPGPASRLFLTPKGRPWRTNSGNFLSMLRKLYRAAGIARRDELGRVVNAHTMRHTFATRLARSGVSIHVAKRLMGHATTDMLDRIYTHIETDDLRAAISSLPSLESADRMTPGSNRSASRSTGVQAELTFEGDAAPEAESIRFRTGSLLRLLPPLTDEQKRGLDEI